MEASTLLINGVIQRNTLLRIPYFQRRYVWGKEDWDRFEVDMESTMDSDKQYFLGALILQQEDVDPSEKDKGVTEQFKVIDGQQRLTTLSIYMRLLHMMVGKNDSFESQYLHDDSSKTPVIRHSIDDRREFNTVMHQDTPQGLQGNVYHLG